MSSIPGKIYYRDGVEYIIVFKTDGKYMFNDVLEVERVIGKNIESVSRKIAGLWNLLKPPLAITIHESQFEKMPEQLKLDFRKFTPDEERPDCKYMGYFNSNGTNVIVSDKINTEEMIVHFDGKSTKVVL